MTTDLVPHDPTTAMTAESEALWPSLLKGRISENIASGALTAGDLPVLRALVVREEALTQPVSRQQMVGVLEALFQHYYAAALPEGAQTQRWKDWHADVGHLPGSVLAEACAAWRRSAAKHAPSPGQLLEKARKDYLVRLNAARRAIKLLEAAEKPVDKGSGAGL